MALKVAVVSESVSSVRGGAETSTSQFLNHLLDQGVSVDLYTRSTPESLERLTVHTIETGGGLRASRTRRFSAKVAQLLAGRRYDVVHAITPCLAADVYQPRGGTVPETVERNLAIRQSSTSRVLKRIGNHFNLKQRAMLRLERQLVCGRRPPVVVAISDYVRRQLTRHYHLDDDAIRLIFNGVDCPPCSDEQRRLDRVAVRQLYGVEEGQVLGLVIAHNFKLKGVAPWLRALRLLRRRHGEKFKTVIIGKASARPYVQLAHSLGVAAAAMFVGPTQRIGEFLHAADVLVHPTYYDPCSRVVLEAMLSGVPPVTTRLNGAAEVITDGVTGQIVACPDDTEDLAQAVEDAAAPEIRSRLEREHDELVGRLSMKRHAVEMIDLYRQIAESKRI
jgi:UDP-glucose:(heptosyl)LPS alpha-1,3-glucosyltransferase